MMLNHKTVGDAITGREELGNRGEPVQALALFYRAFNERDLDLMAESWEDASFVAMDNPLGGITRGWPEIRAIYQRIFEGPSRVTVEFHDYTLQEFGDVFWAVGRERGSLDGPGGRLELAIRTSRMFRRRDGRWRQVHHHGSIDDPGLLGAYQSAVRGSAKAWLLGSWRLVRWHIENTDGTTNYPLGNDAAGQLMYAADGRMSAQLMRRGQTRFAHGDWRQATPQEEAQAWSSYFGYFGTYTIDEPKSTVEHHIEGSWFPNLVGTTEKRRYRFEGEQLVLNAETAWGKVHIVWEKEVSGVDSHARQ
jgi:ketosteroid isomerase-like protein